MILVDWQIQKLAENGLVEPFNCRHINPSSLDVHVGGEAIVTRLDDYGIPRERTIDLTSYTEEHPFLIEPNEFFLSCLKEKITLPTNVASEFKLVSSTARQGWNHLHASWADNGYGGVLTLELVNVNRYSDLPLWAGMRIGQLIFNRTEEPRKYYSKTGRYHGDRTVQKSKGNK